MSDRLEQIFSNANEAESARLMDRFDPETRMDERTQARIRARLKCAIRADAQKKTLRFPWRKALVAVAACAVVYLTLGFTVPGVADSLYRLTHPDYTTEGYLATAPDAREPIAEVDAAVAKTGAKDVESTVELLGEYSIRTQWDEGYNEMAHETPSRRAARGAEPYRAEDYAYLKEINASVKGVYYDGSRLFVNAFLAFPGADAFLSDEHTDGTFPHRLAICTLTEQTKVDGREVGIRLGGSTGNQMTDTQDGSYGLWYTSYFELDEPLPDGVCEMTLFYYIYDADVDDMGAIGNVARVIHTVSFDTTTGNRHANNGFEIAFSGSAPMTVSTYRSTGEHETLANRMVCFDGLKMRVDAAFLPSGVMAELSVVEYPASWTELEKDALADGFITALSFDVVAGDETVHIPYHRIARDNGGWQFEIPVLPSDYAALDSITVVPVVRHVTGFTSFEEVDPMDPEKGVITHDVTLAVGGEAAPITDHFRKADTVETPLTDTRIVLALPNA